MRLIRILPLAVALAVAVVAPVSSASAEYSYSFGAPSELRGKSNLGAMDREETRERPARRERASSRRAQRGEERARRADRRGRSQAARRTVRDSDDEVEQAYEAPRSRSQARRRGTRVASLGSGVEGGWGTGGGSNGVASFYWQPQRVASGGWFNPNAMTAAHKTLPFGTRVRVTHASNGRSVIVRINDRGPYVRGRIIDLSRAAASIIGMTGQGVARIRMEVLGR
jgi:rare lipoprotein A